MTTIRDVAKYANVSVATVSRVLNNKGYVSKVAEEAVQQAISALNYKPNAVARSLYNKKSRMIGLLIPDIANPFFPEVARAIEDVALKAGYTVVLCNTDSKLEKERHYLNTLEQKYVDGIIAATGVGSYDHYKDLNVPIVALDRYISEDVPTVMVENKQGARIATEHLVEQGCTYLVHLRGRSGLGTADDRYEGFKETVERYNVKHIVVETGFNIHTAEAKMRKLLSQHPKIDGIFAGSDVTAAGAMKAAHTLKRAIPDDLQIIGFDGIAYGEMLSPSLSTMKQPIYRIGEKAISLLIEQIEKKNVETHHYVFPPVLQLRGTTKRGKAYE
ncbi:LacI family DNA-binding transcriptional regulator [Alkalihalobacillus sp. LMS6]|uniref:LacI family DNA-binding transcriptional regulator n=1 Tax=Bacillaceae TaxID=186817 RepID=UPI000C08B0F3|nr:MULTISPECIES: LacI family DNA-binding transcriptional regulator [Bacillaceae]UTR06898.1 LacI family DNA-binding transcriptional regulator [Alkalihalobacillus sp. LMS6]